MNNEMLRVLGTITTRNEAGRHFTETVDGDVLARLEAEGLIAVHRPVHETGTPYSCEYWTVEVTPAGQALVDQANEQGFDWSESGELLDVAPARFEVHLAELAAEYGVELDGSRGLDAADGSHQVELYRDDDGWHVDGRGYELLDSEWAPSDEQAAGLWRAVR